jgi:GntR family transcriptional regulator
MNFNLNYSSGMPMYEQIKEKIKQDIFSGKLKNNDVLPSVRQLAKDLNVSMITTKRTYMELEHEGFIYTISGRGTFVKVNDFDEIVLERNKQILSEFETSVNELKKAGIKKESLTQIVEKIFDEGEI